MDFWGYLKSKMSTTGPRDVPELKDAMKHYGIIKIMQIDPFYYVMFGILVHNFLHAMHCRLWRWTHWKNEIIIKAFLQFVIFQYTCHFVVSRHFLSVAFRKFRISLIVSITVSSALLKILRVSSAYLQRTMSEISGPHQWLRGNAQNWKTGGARFNPRSRLST